MSSRLSVARNERSAVMNPAASSRLVFPCPLAPDEKLLPAGKFERGKAHVAKMPQGEFAQAHDRG